MAHRYAVNVTGIAAGADKGIINCVGGTGVRMALYDLLLGSDDTPADQATRFVVNRTTADGVGGTALSNENPLDPADPAATVACTSGAYSTTEPTDTANSELLTISLNQRATFRWVAAPGSEVISPATANNGLFLRSAASTGTPGIEATILWSE